MAEQKFIEDSDEEDDEPQSSPPPVASVLADMGQGNVVNLHRSPATLASNSFQTFESITLSADILNREIQDTHDSVLGSTANSVTSSTRSISISKRPPPSPSMSKAKMKRALSNAEITSPRCYKAARTKNSNPGRKKSQYCISSDGEIEMTSKAVALKGRVGQPEKGVDDEDPGAVDMHPLTKSGLGDQVSSSGSTTGSTIVNVTPAKAMSSRGTSASWNSNSVPVSAETPYTSGSMPPPTISSRGRSDNGITPPEDQTQVNLRSSAIAALQTLPSSDPKQERSSSTSRMSPSNIITMEEATAKLVNPDSKALEDELSRTSPIFHTTGIISPIVLLPQRANDNSKNNRSKETSQLVKDVSNDFCSDDNAMGMPKEQYRPRSSRSRAGFDTTEIVAPVDFSKKPESVAKTTIRPKRKNKRSKTTSFQELRPPNHETEDEEDDLIEASEKLEIPIWKDHSPKSQLDADIENETDGRNVTVEERTSAEAEKTAQQPKKQRGRPRKTIVAEGEERATKTAKGVGEKVSPISDPATSRVAKRPSEIVTTVKLQAEHADEEEERRSHCTSDDESNPKNNVTTSDKVLEESAGNTPKQVSPLMENKANPETPKKPAKAPDKGPDKHSPINSGKVSYRVGLSKRARIEPLLRIVRK